MLGLLLRDEDGYEGMPGERVFFNTKMIGWEYEAYHDWFTICV
jgi:hypothetical protein